MFHTCSAQHMWEYFKTFAKCLSQMFGKSLLVIYFRTKTSKSQLSSRFHIFISSGINQLGMNKPVLIDIISLSAHQGAQGGLFAFGNNGKLHGHMGSQINLTPLE